MSRNSESIYDSLYLGDAITACRQEGILSERTEHLSHVIRSYRNLIHPGRMLRLKEVVDEEGAKVVVALAEIIIDEIVKRRKQNYGYTAEQIISKIANDPSAKAILPYLLRDTNKYEIERLLLHIIPQKYLELKESSIAVDTRSSIEKLFRLSFDIATEETKQKVAKNFIKNIKEH